mgnify:CR=1 FL=1|jgi:DNA-damage-inducible protein J
MTQSSNLNIRMDADLKREFQDIVSELGLTTTVALNAFVKTVVRERRIPLSLDLNVPNKLTLQALEDVKHNKNIQGPYDSVDALMEALDAED